MLPKNGFTFNMTLLPKYGNDDKEKGCIRADLLKKEREIKVRKVEMNRQDGRRATCVDWVSSCDLCARSWLVKWLCCLFCRISREIEVDRSWEYERKAVH